jgi:hypothetical protein
VIQLQFGTVYLHSEPIVLGDPKKIYLLQLAE